MPTFIPDEHVTSFQAAIRQIPELMRELDVEKMMRSNKGRSEGHSRRTEAPLPLNLDAAELQRTLRGLMSVLAHRCPDSVDFGPSPTLSAVTDACAQNAADILRTPDYQTLVDQTLSSVQRARQLVDTPLEKVSLGRCDCGQPLLASRSHPDPHTGVREERETACPQCGTAWYVEATLQSRSELDPRTYAEARLTAVQVEEATAGRVKAGRVRQWIHRGRLQRGDDGLVRLGDVLDLLEAVSATSQQKPAVSC